MNRYSRSLIYFNSLIILCFLSVFAACKKENKANNVNVEKPESICTLKAEQLPAVRGFRLGMTYEEIKKRFPNFCPLSQNPYNENSIKFYKPTGNISSNLPKSCSEMNIESYPEMEGVEGIRFSLLRGVISSFLIEYDETTDGEFGLKFRQTMRETLGLTQFTNWEMVNYTFQRQYWMIPGINNPRLEELLCDKLIVAIGGGTFISGNSPPRYTPFMAVMTTDKTAITKAQSEQERKAAEVKEQEKRDTFKP